MKVLLINSVCKTGSTGKIVYDLYTELNKNDHEAAICYGRGQKVKEHNIYKFSSNWEVYLHVLLTKITGLTGCYSYFATRKLIKFIEKFQPDVIHLHSIIGYFVNDVFLLKYLKNSGVKIICTLHSEEFYTGKCGYTYECNKWLKECGNCPQRKVYPESLFFDFTNLMFCRKKKVMSNFNNIILTTPSKWLVDRVKLSFLKNKNIKIIHNGIDLTDFHIYNANELRKNLKIYESEKILLHVTPYNLLNERKGGKYIIELARKLEGKNIKIVVVGEKTDIDDLPENIIQVGKVYDKCLLAKYYSMADLMVITSKKETFSMVCAESLACGIPVIGFEAGAPSEVAPNGYGVFVKYGDVELLRKKILDYFSGSIKLKSKKECENFAKEEYSRKKMFYRYLSLYCYK
ncbi:MAG: glycosyltransferase [Bacteroidales bacterium]|jgi:glycosyltransferase involved in cell wall biosynthesis|nr:glycosyltransferase [Bacteroidales bacterium]